MMRCLLILLLALPAVAAEKLNWDNDAEVMAHLNRAGGQLIEKKATTPKATLLSQFERKQCRLDLAAGRNAAQDPAALYARARSSVLALAGLYRCKKCTQWHMTTASGFVLAKSGVAATNCHVLKSEEPQTFVAMTSTGDVFPVQEVLAASEPDDLAIIQLAVPSSVALNPLPLADGEPAAPVGTRVSVVSHPEKHFYTFTEGIISRYLDWRQSSNTVKRVTITADFAVGSSGAPVLNARGEVVAVVCATHTVFAGKEHDKREPQMTLKLCAPVQRLRALVAPRTAR
jgi:S1-C subfamily serine protease